MVLPLREVLADLYRDVASIERVLSDATIDTTRIVMQGSALNIWMAGLAEARKQRKMRLLTNVVQGEYPESTELREAIENLIYERPDGYIVYGDGNGNRDALNRIDAELRQREDQLNALRDHVLLYDEKNRKEISIERHNVKDLQGALLLHQENARMKFERLTERLDAQQKRLDSMSNAGRWMLWYGIAAGTSAVVGQLLAMLVMRALGWG